MNTETAQKIANDLIARFETGDIAPVVELSTIHLTSKNTIPSSRWSFSNQLLALFQSGETDCRGFRQWQEVKRHVVTGAKASYIFAPIIIKKVNDEGKEVSILVGFKCIPVFPYSMTEGESLPELEDITPEKLPPLFDVAKKWGIRVDYDGFNNSEYGSYSRTWNNIRLATHEETVFFHELAHAAHGKLETLKGGQDPKQELIAEFTACVLMQVYGLKDTTGNTWNYIKHYNPDNPVKAIMSALDTIGKVLDLILAEA